MQRLLARIFGPIFAKEAIEIARRRRYYFARVLFGLALLWAMWIVSDQWQYRQQNVLLQQRAQMAREFFIAISIVQYGAVFVLLPALLSGVIASEREAGTLDLLLTTQLKDRDIVFGKLVSRVAVVMLLNLCGLSIVSLATLLGGIDPSAIIRVQASTLLAMFCVGSMSIYFTAATRAPLGALIRTYFWLAVWLLFMPAVLVSIGEYYRTTREPVVGILGLTHPVFTFVAGLDSRLYAELARHVGPWFYPASFVLPGLLGMLLLWRGVRRVRIEPSRRRLSTIFGNLWGKLRGTGSPSAKPRRNRWHWWNRESANPLVLRAQLARVYDAEGYVRRLQWAAWLFAIAFLVFFALVDPRELLDDDPVYGFLVPTWIVTILVTALVAGGSLVGDRRRGFLDQMLVTPLESHEIVDGTLRAVWHHVRGMYVLAYALTAVFWMLGTVSTTGGLVSIVCGTLFGWVTLIFGVSCSAVAKTYAMALIPTIVFPLVATIGPPLIDESSRHDAIPIFLSLTVGMLIASAVLRKLSSFLSVGMTLATMFWVLIQAGQLLIWYSGRSTYSDRKYMAFVDPAFWIMEPFEIWDARPYISSWHQYAHGETAVIGYLGAVAVYLAASQWWMIRRFDRSVGREITETPAQRVPAVRST